MGESVSQLDALIFRTFAGSRKASFYASEGDFRSAVVAVFPVTRATLLREVAESAREAGLPVSARGIERRVDELIEGTLLAQSEDILVLCLDEVKTDLAGMKRVAITSRIIRALLVVMVALTAFTWASLFADLPTNVSTAYAVLFSVLAVTWALIALRGFWNFQLTTIPLQLSDLWDVSAFPSRASCERIISSERSEEGSSSQ